MSSIFKTVKLHHAQFLLLVFTGLVMLVGLLAEKLIVSDFTNFHFSSISEYLTKITSDIELFIKKPKKEALSRDLIGAVLVVLVVLVHFLYGMQLTDSLYTSTIATILFAVPVFYISYLVNVAFSPRSSTMPASSLPK